MSLYCWRLWDAPCLDVWNACSDTCDVCSKLFVVLSMLSSQCWVINASSSASINRWKSQLLHLSRLISNKCVFVSGSLSYWLLPIVTTYRCIKPMRSCGNNEEMQPLHLELGALHPVLNEGVRINRCTPCWQWWQETVCISYMPSRQVGKAPAIYFVEQPSKIFMTLQSRCWVWESWVVGVEWVEVPGLLPKWNVRWKDMLRNIICRSGSIEMALIVECGNCGSGG